MSFTNPKMKQTLEMREYESLRLPGRWDDMSKLSFSRKTRFWGPFRVSSPRCWWKTAVLEDCIQSKNSFTRRSKTTSFCQPDVWNRKTTFSLGEAGWDRVPDSRLQRTPWRSAREWRSNSWCKQESAGRFSMFWGSMIVFVRSLLFWTSSKTSQSCNISGQRAQKGTGLADVQPSTSRRTLHYWNLKCLA